MTTAPASADGGHSSVEGHGRTPRKRVAVIAVHGVADQARGETVRRCANLLVSSGEERAFAAVAEEALRLRVDPVLEAPSVRSSPERLGRRLAERATFQSPAVFEALKGSAEAAGDAKSDLAHEELKDQLRDADLPQEDRVWETLRIRALGPESAGTPDERCEVHVYELYWADLSRLGNNLLGVFLQLYQLLFFLPGLGSRTLGSAVARLKGSEGFRPGLWKAYGGSHAIATRLLVILVPAANLTLLSLAAVLGVKAVERFDRELLPWIAGVVAAILFGAAIVWSVLGRRWARSWPWLLLAVAGAASLVVLLARRAPYAAAAWALWLVVAAGVVWLLLAYSRRVPGALTWSLLLIVPFCGYYLIRLWGAENWAAVFEAALETAQIVIEFPHRGLWALLGVLLLLASVLGQLAARFGTSPGHRARARHAVWTADLALCLPAAAVLLIDAGLWAGLVRAAGMFLGPEEVCGTCVRPGLLEKELELAALDGLLRSAIPAGFEWSFVVAAIAVLCAAWAILPALASDRLLRDTRWLGRNLDAAFVGWRVVGEGVRWLLAAGLVAAVVRGIWYWMDHEPVPGASNLTAIGLLGGALAIAIMGSQGPTRFLALGLRSALDVALDVLNWLRHDPPRQAPSSRIASRYASLLRYVCAWRDSRDDGPYQAVVIAAHSQGTVITADLLRFLRLEYPAPGAPPGMERIFGSDGERLPVYFLSFGCPLRQIYALRFPDRYRWAADFESASWEESRACSPGELEVRAWSNLYRSGDYIGRTLWHPPKAFRNDDAWSDTRMESASGDRRELCIGAGSHNRYWDSPELADELDFLIRRACSSPESSGAEA